MQKQRKNVEPKNKAVAAKKKSKVVKSSPKRKTSSKEKARYDDMRQIDWFPADPYND